MGLVVQILVMLVGDDLVEVAGDGADVAVDGPLVVIEDNDQPLCLVGDIVERFKGDAVGEGGVSGNGDDMLVAAGEIAGDGHAQGRGEGSAGVTGSVTIVLAFGAQHEAVEAAGLTQGFKAVEPSGQDFVDIGLVADVEEELVLGSVEDRVEGQGQLHDAEVGAEVAAGLRKGLNQELANLFGQCGHLSKAQTLEIGRRMDGLQQCSHEHPSPGNCRVVPRRAKRLGPNRPSHTARTNHP